MKFHMNFNLYNTLIELYISNEDFYNISLKIFSSLFEVTSINSSKNFDKIIISEINNNIIIKSVKEIYTIQKIKTTDLYPILYGIIYNCMVKQGKMCVHSSVVTNLEKSFLLLGDFGSGKTFLCKTFEEFNWNIISADQTIIEYQDTDLYMLVGSNFLKQNNQYCWINDSNIRIKRKIDGIIILRGMAEGGKIKIENIQNFNGKVRKFAYSVMWPFITPLTNETIFTYNYIQYCNAISKVLKNIMSVPVFHIRGDAYKCVDILTKL